MRAWMRRLSVRWKLVIGISGLTLTTLLIVGGYYPQKMFNASYAQLRAEALAVQRILAKELSTAVEFGDSSAARAALLAVTAIKDVEYASVYLLDGQQLTELGQPALLRGRRVALDGTEHIEARGGYLWLAAPILGIEGRPEGSLVLVFSMQRLAQQRTIQLGQIGLFGSGALILGLLVAFVLHQTVVAPIIRVTEGVKRIAGGENAPDIPIVAQDEIGQLAAAFNRMRDDLRRTTVSKAYVADVLDATADILLVVAPDGRLRSANRAARELLALPTEPQGEPLVRWVEEMVHGELDSILGRICESAAPLNFELKLRGADGTSVPTAVNASTVVDRLSGTRSVILMARDLRETLRLLAEAASAEAERHKAAEMAQAYQELEQAHRQLKEAQAHLLQSGKMAAIGQMAAGIAHEINNPLSAVLTYAELLQERLEESSTQLPPSLADMGSILDRIRTGVTRCKSISDNLLSFSRQADRKVVPVNLALVIDKTLELIGTRLTRSQVQLVRDVPAALWVMGGESTLQQVLTNLMINAVQAMSGGGTLTMQAAADGGRVTLRVRDTGCGISAEHLDRIFEPFYTTKPVGQGTGLGLYIVHGLLTDMGATVDVTSTPGAGTTFSVQLQLAQGAQAMELA